MRQVIRVCRILLVEREGQKAVAQALCPLAILRAQPSTTQQAAKTLHHRTGSGLQRCQLFLDLAIEAAKSEEQRAQIPLMYPPSTGMLTPLMYIDRGDARKATTW